MEIQTPIQRMPARENIYTGKYPQPIMLGERGWASCGRRRRGGVEGRSDVTLEERGLRDAVAGRGRGRDWA
jgi:hypothetical protein